MVEQKTKPTDISVESFIAGLDDAGKQDDSRRLIALMQRATGAPPRMWGPSIIGFGSYHYRYESGHEGESCLVGFSPRKAEFSIYLNGGYAGADDARDAMLAKLGKHRLGKGCLYLKRLDGVDLDVLGAMVRASVTALRQRYPAGKA